MSGKKTSTVLLLVWLEVTVRVFILCVNTWIAQKIYSYSREILDGRKHHANSPNKKSPKIKKKNNNPRYLIAMSLSSMTFMMYGNLSAIIGSIALLENESTTKSKKPLHKLLSRKYSLVWFCMLSHIMSTCLGQASLTDVAFERLRRIFKHTQYKVTDIQTKMIRLVIVLLLTMQVPGMVLIFGVNNGSEDHFRLLLPTTMIALMLYLGVNGWIVWSFFDRSLNLVRGLESSKHQNNDSSSSHHLSPSALDVNDDDHLQTPQSECEISNLNHSKLDSESGSNLSVIGPSSDIPSFSVSPVSDFHSEMMVVAMNQHRPSKISLSNKHSLKLADTSLRITISCAVPLILALLFTVFLVMSVFLKLKMGLILFRNLLILGNVFNNIGIMFTFRQAQNYYRFWYGAFHRWLFARVFHLDSQLKPN